MKKLFSVICAVLLLIPMRVSAANTITFTPPIFLQEWSGTSGNFTIPYSAYYRLTLSGAQGSSYGGGEGGLGITQTKTLWLREGTQVKYQCAQQATLNTSVDVMHITAGDSSKLWFDNVLQATSSGGQGVHYSNIAPNGCNNVKLYEGGNDSFATYPVHWHTGNKNTYGGCYTTPVYHQHTGAFAVHGDSISPVHDDKTYGYITDWEWNGVKLSDDILTPVDGKGYVQLSSALAGTVTAARVDGCFEYFRCPGSWYSLYAQPQTDHGLWDHNAACSYIDHNTTRPFTLAISPIRYDTGDLMSSTCPYILCRRICGKTTASIDSYLPSCGYQQGQIVGIQSQVVGSSDNTWVCDSSAQNNKGAGKFSIQLVEQNRLGYATDDVSSLTYKNNVANLVVYQDPKTNEHYALFVKHTQH